MKTIILLLAFAALFSVPSVLADEAATINKLISDLNADAKKEGGEGRVVKSIAKSTGVSAETLQAEKARTGLSWGEVYMAHAIAKGSKKSFDQVAALKAKGKSWPKIAQENNVTLGAKGSGKAKQAAAATPSPSPKPGQPTGMPTWKPVRGY